MVETFVTLSSNIVNFTVSSIGTNIFTEVLLSQIILLYFFFFFFFFDNFGDPPNSSASFCFLLLFSHLFPFTQISSQLRNVLEQVHDEKKRHLGNYISYLLSENEVFNETKTVTHTHSLSFLPECKHRKKFISVQTQTPISIKFGVFLVQNVQFVVFFLTYIHFINLF